MTMTTERYLFEDGFAALHERGVQLLADVVALVGDCRALYDEYEPKASKIIEDLPGDAVDEGGAWVDLAVRSGLDAVCDVLMCIVESSHLDPGATGDRMSPEWLARVADRYGITEHLRNPRSAS